MGATSTLPMCHTRVSGVWARSGGVGVRAFMASGVPVWRLLPRGRPDHLALVARGACVPGTQRIVTIRDSSWQASAPVYCTDCGLKHSEGGPLASPGASPEGQVRFATQPEFCRAARAGAAAAGRHLCALPLRPPVISQEGVHTLVWSPQEAPPDRLALVTRGPYACQPAGLCICAYFKSCSPKVWISVSLNLSTD